MKRSRGPEEDGSSYDEQGAAVASAPKIVTTDPENLDDAQAAVVTLQCSLPGHAPVSFTRYDDYEQHYNNAHTNRCLDCRKNFPSPHVLDLHIRELHDALTEIKREKGENVYACFVESCKDNFKTLGKRQDHLVKAHMFPRNYFFAVTKFGIDRRQSMLVEYRKKGASQREESTSQRSKPKHNLEVRAAVNEQGEDIDTSRDVPMNDEGALAEEPEGPSTRSVASKDVPMGEPEPLKPSTTKQSEGPEKPKTPGGDVGLPKDFPMIDGGALAAAEQQPQTPTKTTKKTTIVDTEMEDLTGAMSSLKFVPRTLRLGPKKKVDAVNR